jgi:peptidoglycan/xylan/chitin deacetylase (PgdA/CDA1 family)
MGRPNAHEILFSFDDGPNPGTTDRLLPMLDRAGIHAVFFVCGWRLEAEEPLRSRARAILRNTLARGHVIGNHTVHHRVLPNLSTAQIAYEIDHNAELIEEVIGQRPHLFRPPYGAYSEDVRRVVTARRYELWLWSIDSHDWQRVNDADGVAQAVITLIGNHAGGTVLLHDTHPWSVAAVPRILRWIDETNRERAREGRAPYTIMDAPRYLAGARERLRLLPGAAAPRDAGADSLEPPTGAVGGGDPDAQVPDAARPEPSPDASDGHS